MKKLLGIFLMAPAIASAQVFAMPNQGGGEIVLTTRACIVKGKNYDGLREAYSWSPTIKKMPACWTVRDGYVVLVYLDDGEERIYPIENFREKK